MMVALWFSCNFDVVVGDASTTFTCIAILTGSLCLEVQLSTLSPPPLAAASLLKTLQVTNWGSIRALLICFRSLKFTVLRCSLPSV